MLEVFFHELKFFLVCIARHVHDGVFYAVGIGNLVKLEAFLFASGLNKDIAVIEHRREKALHLARRVLNAEEVELAHGANKQSFLFDIHDAFVGDNPDVEIVVDPDEERKEPEKDEENAFNKDEESPIDGGERFRIHKHEEHKDADNHKKPEQERYELHENIEPVAMNHKENFFVVVLPFERAGASEFFVGCHHMLEDGRENVEMGRMRKIGEMPRMSFRKCWGGRGETS